MSYVTNEEHGTNWTMKLGDSCERLAEIETDSVGLTVYSPPFASLFTYSPSPRDLGNSATRDDFIEHYSFILRELLRVTPPPPDEPASESSIMPASTFVCAHCGHAMVVLRIFLRDNSIRAPPAW